MEREAFNLLPVSFAIAAIAEERLGNASGLLANTATPRHMEPSAQQIRALARRIWEAEGRPKGRETANWLEAEARLSALNAHLRSIRESTAW